MTGVLITGGTGTFGREFAKTLLENTEIDRICIYSRGEHAQADMACKLADDDERMRYFIGDVRDRDRLKRAMHGCKWVVHAAALKRIEVGFYNPIEMVRTNIDGAVNVIEAAQDAGVETVVGLSTDKAYQPISPYGQSKALAESLFLAANFSSGGCTKFSVVRYGNVWKSNGSVVPRWEAMREAGIKIVPVTDPDCTRFYMTKMEACSLVLNTLENTEGQELVIPNLPAYRVGDLARAMGLKMRVIGLPHWEKRHESMADGNSSDKARRMSVKELRKALEAE